MLGAAARQWHPPHAARLLCRLRCRCAWVRSEADHPFGLAAHGLARSAPLQLHLVASAVA